MAKRVLICDDAAFMWMMLKDVLSRGDYEVVGEAQNGQRAVEQYAALAALRKLEGSDLAELPEKSVAPQMTITIGAGEKTIALTVDQLNTVADVYYVYDESGAAYTVMRSDLATLSKSPRDLYKAQTLTDKTLSDVAAMQVNDLQFTQTDGSWTLTDDPDYPVSQSSISRAIAIRYRRVWA